MNFRNQRFVMVIRILFGAFMVFSGIGGLKSGASLEGIPVEMLPTMKVLWATGIFQMIKVTEIVAGLMLVTGLYPALAAIFLAPICIGVIIVNLRMTPDFLFMGFIISALNIFLGYAYWDKYKKLFERK